jgi:uncharacterized protein involved in outer membrane biogenesis
MNPNPTPQPTAPAGRGLRRLKRGLAWAVLALLLLVIVPPALVVLGVTVDASPWRAELARALGESLDREVSFDGKARIRLSLHPELVVGGIRIANPPGYGSPDLATLGEARFRVELLPLLRRQLKIGEVSASDLKVRLEVLADGRANWQLGGARAPPAASDADRPEPGSRALQRDDIAGLGLERATFERIAVEFVSAGGKPHHFLLDTLEASAADGQPLRLTSKGRVEGSFPYALDVDGGTLTAMMAAREPWPLKVVLSFAGTRLELDGRVPTGAQGGAADLTFALRTDDLSQLEQLLQVKLPPVGATRLAARVKWRFGLLELIDLDGRMGQTELAGQLALDTTGAVPRVRGALSIPVLDLGPFRGRASASEAPPANLLETYRSLQSESFDLRRLATLNADLRLEVGRWASLPGDVRDAALSIRLEGGVLQAPLQVTAAGVPLNGRLDVDASVASPTFVLALSTRATRLGRLAELLAGVKGVEGRAERFDLGLAAHGDTLGDLTRSLAVKLSLDGGRLSYGNEGGARPVSFRLDRFELAMPAGSALRGAARGALLDEPFKAEFSGGDLPTLARGARWPIAVRAQGSGARLDVNGQLPAASGQAATELAFAFDAPRAGTVARWLGLAPDAQAPVRIDGRLTSRPDEVWLRDLSLALGRTRMAGEVGRVAAAGGARRVQARLEIADVDVAQLQTLMPAARPDASGKPAADLRSTLELPILPTGIDLEDADLRMSLRRVLLPTTEVTDVHFEGRIREGRMTEAPFGATVAGTPFTGLASFDLRGTVPEVALALAATKVDVGALLKRLKVAEDVDAQVDALDVSLLLRGARLGELLERSSLKAGLRGGQLRLHDPAGRTLAVIAIGEGGVEAMPGEPLRLTLEGRVDTTPVSIRMASGRLSALAQPGARVPLKLSAQAAGATLDVEGSARVPLTQRDGDLVLRLSGDRLDTLDTLARTALPPWGPWSLSGRFAMTARGYEMPALALRVGASRLEGSGSVEFSGERPKAVLALKASTLQLDDFRFGDWSPTAPAPPAPKEAQSAEQLRERARAAAQQGQALLSRDALLKQDVELDVEVAQVLSGADRLGNGRLSARLQAARLDVSHLEVRVPEGAARLALRYEPLPGDREVALSTRLRVDRFDYAVLARRIRPQTDLQGLFSLHLDLAATAPLERLMQSGDGRLDVAVWPVNLKAGVFDLWAVNVFVAILPALDGSATSKVNCAIARFDLRRGRMTEDLVLVDTTRLRAGGTARVDFNDESLAVLLQPRPKQPQFFSLGTPVEVSGRLTDYKVGLPSGSIVGTVGRFLGSIVTTPYQMLFSRPLPDDGSDVCESPMRAGA